MTPEQSFYSSLFIAILTLVIAPVLTSWLNRRNKDVENKSLDAKTEFDISKAAQAISDGSTVAITNLLRSIEFLKQENTALSILRIERESRIVTLESTLTQHIKDQEKDTKELTELRTYVIKIDEKYRIMKGVAEKLVRALQENDPPIPIPNLNGDLAKLGDSVHGLKVWAKK